MRQAWIFAALESEKPAGYWGLALLYALPWLTEGLRLDGFTVACLLAGAVHVQARGNTNIRVWVTNWHNNDKRRADHGTG